MLFFIVLVSFLQLEMAFSEWNASDNGQILWKDNCDFDTTVNVGWKLLNTIESIRCGSFCLNNSACSHFSQTKDKCYLKLAALESTNPISSPMITCGYIPARIWRQSTVDQRILVQSNCTFAFNNVSKVISDANNSLNLCQKACLDDHRCNAFSYTDGKCTVNLPIGSLEWTDPHFVIESSSYCGVILTRIWIRSQRLGNKVLWQNNCDFEGYEMGNLPSLSSDNCESYCSAYPRCTHFSYQHGTCYLKNVTSSQADPVKLARTGFCGFIPQSTTNISNDNGLATWIVVLIFLVVAAVVIIFVASIIGYYKYKVFINFKNDIFFRMDSKL